MPHLTMIPEYSIVLEFFRMLGMPTETPTDTPPQTTHTNTHTHKPHTHTHTQPKTDGRKCDERQTNYLSNYD